MTKRKRTARKIKPQSPVTLAAAPWDIGATGPANRVNLAEEPATDIDPETGRETPNPNGVRRQRRETMVAVYAAKGHIDQRQHAAAVTYRMAAEGMR